MEELIKRYPSLEPCKEDIQKALQLMINTYKSGGKILVCGNGGSAADSDHIVGELMKGFVNKRPVTNEKIPQEMREFLQGALPVISLSGQIALFTAYSNDVSPDMVYAQMVFGYGKENDLLIALSTSGNSKNIVNAAKVASSLGVRTIAFTGETGGALSEICNVSIKVPSTKTYKVQEFHLPVYHYLCMETEKYFFGS